MKRRRDRRSILGLAIGGGFLGGSFLTASPAKAVSYLKFEQKVRDGGLCPTMFGARATGSATYDAVDLAALNAYAEYVRNAPTDGEKFVGRKIWGNWRNGLAFVVADSVNWTAMSGRNVVHHCNGAQINLYCTGKVGIDLLGSNALKIHDLLIRGDEVNVPRIGLQIGRFNATGQEQNDFYHLQIVGAFSRAGLLAEASETTCFHTPIFRNYDSTPGTLTTGSYAWILDGWNNENITSEFVTVTLTYHDPISCADFQFDKYWGSKTFNVASQLGRGAEGLITNDVGVNSTVKNFTMRRSYGNVFSGPNIDIDGDLTNFNVEKHNETQAPTNSSPPWETGPTHAIRSITPGVVTWTGFRFQDNNPHAWVAGIGKEPSGGLYITLGDVEIESMQHNRTLFAPPSISIDNPVTGLPETWLSGPIHYSGALRLGSGNSGDDYNLRDLRDLASFNGVIYSEAPANTVLMPTSEVGSAQIFGQRVIGSTSNGSFRLWGGAAVSGRSPGTNYLQNADFAADALGVGPFTVNGITLDSWELVNGTTASNSILRVAGEFDADYAIEWTRTAAGSTTSFFRQLIGDLRHFAGQAVVYSFEIKAAAAGTVNLGVSLSQYFGTGGAPSAGVVVTAQNFTISTLINRYEIMFTVPSIIGKTFGTNNDDGLYARFQRGELQENGVFYIQNAKVEIAPRGTAFITSDPGQESQTQAIYWNGTVRVDSALGTLALGVKTASSANIYGAGSVTAFGLNAGQAIFCVADSAFTIVYNAATLVIPGASNVNVLTGDTWWVKADQYGRERVYGYERNTAP